MTAQAERELFHGEDARVLGTLASEIKRRLSAGAGCESVGRDVLYLSSLGKALSYVDVDVGEVDLIARRLQSLLTMCADPFASLMGTARLLQYRYWADRKFSVGPLLAHGEAIVLREQWTAASTEFACVAALWHARLGTIDKAFELLAIASSQPLVKANSSQFRALRHARAAVLMNSGDLGRADIELKEISKEIALPCYEQFQLINSRTSLALRQLDSTAASRLAAEALSLAKRLFIGGLQLARPQLHSAYAALMQGARMQGEKHLASARYLERSADLSKAELRDALWRLYWNPSNVVARHALELASARGATGVFRSCPYISSSICGLGLQRPDVSDWAAAVIRNQSLRCEDDNSPLWPRPLSVFVFGRVRVVRDGVAERESPKSKHRIVEMLALLVLAGEIGVERGQMAAALWPDATPTQSSKLLTMTVLRLRRWLSEPKAVVVANNRIRLDSAVAWTDVQAIHRITEMVDDLPARFDDSKKLLRIFSDLIAIYLGPAAPEVGVAGVDRARLRLARAFVKTSERLQEHLRRNAMTAEADRLWAANLEVQSHTGESRLTESAHCAQRA